MVMIRIELYLQRTTEHGWRSRLSRFVERHLVGRGQSLHVGFMSVVPGATAEVDFGKDGGAIGFDWDGRRFEITGYAFKTKVRELERPL